MYLLGSSPFPFDSYLLSFSHCVQVFFAFLISRLKFYLYGLVSVFSLLFLSYIHSYQTHHCTPSEGRGTPVKHPKPLQTWLPPRPPHNPSQPSRPSLATPGSSPARPDTVSRTGTWPLTDDKETAFEVRGGGSSGGYDYAVRLQVLRGTTYTGKAVQLIYAPRMSAVDHALLFHSAMVQCFICLFPAVHFYWDLTVQKKAWAWQNNTALLTGKPDNTYWAIGGTVGEMHSVMRGPKPWWCNDGVLRNDRGLLEYSKCLVPAHPEASDFPLAAATRSTSSPLSRRPTTKNQSSPSSSTCPLSCALLASTSTLTPRIYQVCAQPRSAASMQNGVVGAATRIKYKDIMCKYWKAGNCHGPDCYFAHRRDAHHVDLKSATCSFWARNQCKDGDNCRYKHSHSLYRNGGPWTREVIKMSPALGHRASSLWTARAFAPASPHDGPSPGSGSRCPRSVSFVFRNFTGFSSFHSICIAYIFTYTTRSLRRASLSWELWKPGRRILQLHRHAQHPHPMLESHRRAKIRGPMILRGSKPRRFPVQLHTGRHQPLSTNLRIGRSTAASQQPKRPTFRQVVRHNLSDRQPYRMVRPGTATPSLCRQGTQDHASTGP
jgi:hypothetical protein